MYGAEVGRKFKGERWTVEPRNRETFPTDIFKVIEEYDLNTWVGQRHNTLGRYDIHWGNNSGHSAINLCYLLGAHTIYLLGYDMGDDNGKVHWHGDHPAQLNNGQGLYDRWIEDMEPLARDLETEGVQVINCSRRTRLSCFPRATVEEICQD